MPRLDFGLANGVVYNLPIIYGLAHCCGWGGVVGHYTGSFYGGHMIHHEVVTLEASVPCVLFVHLWDLYGVAIIFLCVWRHDFCIIGDGLGRLLGWLP